jgi:hypothetical protein
MKLCFNLVGKVNKSDQRGNESNFIGFNPTLLGRRIASLSYTRALGKNFGIRGSLGFSYKPDPIIKFSVTEFTDEVVEESSLSEETKDSRWLRYLLSNSEGNEGVNFFYELGLKYFLDEETSNSPYFELSYRTYNNNFVYSNSSHTANPINLSLNSRALQFVSGRNFNFSHSVHDVYLGLGLKFLSINRPGAEFSYDSFGYKTIKFSDPDGVKAKLATYSILVGYVYHFGF